MLSGAHLEIHPYQEGDTVDLFVLIWHLHFFNLWLQKPLLSLFLISIVSVASSFHPHVLGQNETLQSFLPQHGYFLVCLGQRNSVTNAYYLAIMDEQVWNRGDILCFSSSASCVSLSMSLSFSAVGYSFV